MSEDENLNFEMEILDENLKDEIEMLMKLKDDFLNGKIEYTELIDAVKQSLEVTGKYKILLDDIIKRIETGSDPVKN